MPRPSRVALITGSAWGIGRATAELFVREGATVAIADIDEQAGAALAGDLGALFLATDVTNEASVAAAVAAVERHSGRLDILFNSAGGSVSEDGGPPSSCSPAASSSSQEVANVTVIAVPSPGADLTVNVPPAT